MARRTPRQKRTSNELQQLRKEAQDQEINAQRIIYNSKAADSVTRQRIAVAFLGAYFALLALILIGVPLYNVFALRFTGQQTYTIDLIDLIQAYSSVVGPALGFVIAYYFKNKND